MPGVLLHRWANAGVGATDWLGKRKFADYVLFYQPNQPIAVIEAKDNNHSIGAGIQQALGYAKALQVPFVFSSNGDAFLFHDRSGTYSPGHWSSSS